MNKKKENKRYFAILLGIVICSFGFSGCQKENKADIFDVNNFGDSSVTSQTQTTSSQESAIPKPVQPVEQEQMVTINVGNYGRPHPFVPYSERGLVISPTAFGKIPLLSADIPAPPRLVEEDPTVKAMMQAKVGGILYDGRNSSAILNIMGEDHLVHTGDRVFDFYIQQITRDKVIIRSGANVYQAGVGELVEGELIKNEVSNLNNRFAGSSRKYNKSVSYTRKNTSNPDVEVIETVN